MTFAKGRDMSCYGGMSASISGDHTDRCRNFGGMTAIVSANWLLKYTARFKILQ